MAEQDTRAQDHVNLEDISLEHREIEEHSCSSLQTESNNNPQLNTTRSEDKMYG